MLLMAIKSVSACSYISGSDKPVLEMLADISFYTTVYFISIFLLFIANAALFISREKTDYLFLAIVIGMALIMIPLTFFGMIMEGCDLLFSILKWELIIIAATFAIHLGLWATGTSLPTWRINNGDRISLKLK